MIRKLLIAFVSLGLIVSLTGCETMGGPKQTGGTIIGAIGGAAIGSQFGKGSGRIVATALGTFLGAQIGASIGKNMDEKDKQLAGKTAAHALEISQIIKYLHGEILITTIVENS